MAQTAQLQPLDGGRDSDERPTGPPLPKPIAEGSPSSWSYFFIRLLFVFVLRVFYSNVVVEGVENIPQDGVPCMLCANHSNSLTDALLLVTTVPTWKRRLLRLTAKDSQFGRKTFTSWLIESAGTVPIKRQKEHGKAGTTVDNSAVFEKLIDALGKGDMVCIFPEGMSRYYPQIAPLKQGVARILSDTLTRHEHQQDFKVAVQTCSITYLHRNLFRSDVLVTFHPPIIVTPETHPGLIARPRSEGRPGPDEDSVRRLTSSIGTEIRSGILDAPSWTYIRAANTCRRLYAPLGTKLGLGEHVRLTQRFVEGLTGRKAIKPWQEGEDVKGVLKTPMRQTRPGEDYFGSEKSESEDRPSSQDDLDLLVKDLTNYQDLLYVHGIKDDRVRNPRLLRRRTLVKRLLVRFLGATALFVMCLPGLVFWTPIFVIATKASRKFKKAGPVFDTYDEVAQTKLVYGLIVGVIEWLSVCLLTLPLSWLTLFIFPTLLWLTLRWLEDLTSSLRASIALFRLLLIGKRQLRVLRDMRESLRIRVENLAVKDCGLPRDAEKYIERQRGWRLASSLGFFSLRRRRKKDWNESLKLFDVSEYPGDDMPSDLVSSVPLTPAAIAGPSMAKASSSLTSVTEERPRRGRVDRLKVA
ncbi:BZ3500_MvSof-1268-A1-R1_Chr3-3g06429 [Microbotryum saponariae]|uniref:BZ3500_MvSof-1268-A1-R1_Chr3-3g06429 protein n=1 Tax=Microbotryum saponariae TaxID=289078 RepID=A0A2X0NG23_9BASI|nr:BZ3500_MvSof-1268-A1-R1_Chr3-3g06429 [Microbotryum saponariae]SDA04396.1 BZ3501_MvSof-1269-A2-R1_Chr3-2g06116 [Microbotryum saponariae]